MIRTLAILQKWQEWSFWKMVDVFFIVRTHLQQLVVCLNFSLVAENFILLVQMKDVMPMSYSSTAS